MCHLCWSLPPSPKKLTRRQFIHGGITAGLAAALTACTPSSPTEPGRFITNIEPANPDSQSQFPTVAGQLQTINAAELTLQSMSHSQTFTVNRQTTWQRTDGQISSLNQHLPPPPVTSSQPQTVLIWQENERVTHIQELPPISATNELPAVAQNGGTGETVPFGPLSLISREGWGAKPRQWVQGGESGEHHDLSNPNGWLTYDEPLKDHIHTAVVHHSALEFWHGPQMVQALHMTAAKFADVGYHFLIDGFGQLYEGRPLNVRGSHTGGFNTGYVGICLLGNFEIAPPIQSQLNTFYQLLAYLRQTYTLTQLGGHRDFQPGVTVCPGQNLHPQLPSLAAQLGYTYHQS